MNNRQPQDDGFHRSSAPQSRPSGKDKSFQVGTGWPELDQLAFSRNVVSKADQNDLSIVQYWEKLSLIELSKVNSIPSKKLISVLFDISRYYEYIGDISKIFPLLHGILRLAKHSNDNLLQRRTHNFLGACYSRVSDFRSSFEQAKLAYNLCIKTSDPAHLLATLANIAATLYEAGFSNEAKNIAVRASLLPSTSALLDYLHLTNAHNGIKFSHSVGDSDSADRFFKIASSKFSKTNHYITAINSAYFYSYTAHHLTLIGKATAAIAILERTSSQLMQRNFRIDALINCALAAAYESIGDSKNLKTCEKRLIILSKNSLSTHHEEILRTLTHLSKSVSFSNSERQRYSRSLREFLLIKRHGQFFDNIARNYLSSDNFCLDKTESAVKLAPGWMRSLGKVDDIAGGRAHNENKSGLSNYVVCSKLEEELRSEQFEVAEDWAIAAEYQVGDSGGHCFSVGEIVRIIANECRVGARLATKMGMAARLHDIGKIAITAESSARAQGRPLDDFGSICRHSEAGRVLMAGSSDPVLQVAAKIAASHHEWWNGCGPPTGLKGDEIPLEARLCAVADVFVGMLQPKLGESWSMTAAAEQLSSMAGVQLDPELVGVLLRIVRASTDDQLLSFGLNRNRLLRTKKSLFDSLELNICH